MAKKIKLSPELAYVIGLWRKKKTKEGIGIKGSKEDLEVFTKEILKLDIVPPNKILNEENKVYFYHTKYRKFFQQVIDEQIDRFKYLNEYAANYLAGWFDAVGDVDQNGRVILKKCNREDEMVLYRLGFIPKRTEDGGVIIGRPKVFLKFIKNYVKIKKDHPIFDIVIKNKK